VIQRARYIFFATFTEIKYYFSFNYNSFIKSKITMEGIIQSSMMTKKEAALFCKVSIATINRWMKLGKISYLKLGRKVLFNQAQVIEDLERFKITN